MQENQQKIESSEVAKKAKKAETTSQSLKMSLSAQ
jgi:hypothetical protein